MPLKPASPASWPIWASNASNCVARVSWAAVSDVCLAWLTSDWADCTSLVIAVMTVVGRLNGIDGVRHRVEQAAQVVGAVVEALRGEEVDRVVEGRIDPLAGGKAGSGSA